MLGEIASFAQKLLINTHSFKYIAILVTNRPNHLKITISILHVFPQVQSLSLFPHKVTHPGLAKTQIQGAFI